MYKLVYRVLGNEYNNLDILNSFIIDKVFPVTIDSIYVEPTNNSFMGRNLPLGSINWTYTSDHPAR